MFAVAPGAPELKFEKIDKTAVRFTWSVPDAGGRFVRVKGGGGEEEGGKV